MMMMGMAMMMMMHDDDDDNDDDLFRQVMAMGTSGHLPPAVKMRNKLRLFQIQSPLS